MPGSAAMASGGPLNRTDLGSVQRSPSLRPVVLPCRSAALSSSTVSRSKCGMTASFGFRCSWVRVRAYFSFRVRVGLHSVQRQ